MAAVRLLLRVLDWVPLFLPAALGFVVYVLLRLDGWSLCLTVH